MKKILLIISFGVLGLILTTGCSNNNDRFIQLTFPELQEKLQAEESFPLYIGSARCSACVEFQPTLKRVIRNHDFIVYHIDLDKFSDNESEELVNMFNISGTPSLLYIVDGEESSTLNRVIGNVPEQDLINSLKNNGYIE